MARSKDTLRSKLKEKYKIDDADVLELEKLFDGDLDEVATQLKSAQKDLTAAKEDVSKWNVWYKDNRPVIDANQQAAEEALELRKRLEAAGLGVGDRDDNQPNRGRNDDFDPQAMESRIYFTSSQIMKDLTRAATVYLKDFNEVLDLDAIEKLVHTKNIRVSDAFQELTREKYAEKAKKEETERIDRLVTERVEAERAKFMAPTLRPIKNTFLSDWIGKTAKGEEAKPITREEEYAAFVRDLHEVAH